MKKSKKGAIDKMADNSKPKDVASPKKKAAWAEKLQGMDRRELKDLLIATLRAQAEAKKALVQKDRLIAEFTSRREVAKLESENILKQARIQAKAIKEEARLTEQQAERVLNAANADVARKLANAEEEADSIVRTHLMQAQADIKRLEARRDAAKKAAIMLNANIAEQYDSIINELETHISTFKDMKLRLDSLNVDIEAEDFKKFNMADFVTANPALDEALANPAIIATKTYADLEDDDMSLEDEDLAVLSTVLSENFDEDEDERGIIPDDGVAEELLTEDGIEFLTEEDDEIELDELDEDDEDDVDDEDDEELSFTESFMVVAPVDDDDDDDLTDIDTDALIDKEDDDDDFDDEFLDDDDDYEEPQIKVPPRRRRRSGGTARWV